MQVTRGSGSHADLWPIKICHSTILRLNSSWNSSLLQNMKYPSWTQVNRLKWSSDRTENGKCTAECTDITNRRSRVGQSSPFYTCFLCVSVLWELEDKRNLENLLFWPERLGAILIYRTWPIRRCFSWTSCSSWTRSQQDDLKMAGRGRWFDSQWFLSPFFKWIY